MGGINGASSFVRDKKGASELGVLLLCVWECPGDVLFLRLTQVPIKHSHQVIYNEATTYSHNALETTFKAESEDPRICISFAAAALHKSR